MAIDGSFSLESSFKTFLARCPELLRFPQFNILANKENMMGEEEVINTVVKLFLHPNYTVPLMGCFRPIAQKIVDKVVSHLRLAPNLRSNSVDAVAQLDHDKILNENEIVNVIEFYVKGARGLDLHELACLGFCRVLDLAPFLLGSVLNYFKFAPPPFERLIKGTNTKVGISVLLPVRTSYRLLLVETEVFSKLWDWSSFVDLVKPYDMDDLGCAEEVVVSDIRWCGVQILSVVLKMGYQSTLNLSVGSEDAFACLLRWEEFCQDISVEKAAWYIELSEQGKSVSDHRSTDFNIKNCLNYFGLSAPSMSSKLDEFESPMRSRRLNTWSEKSDGNSFVFTISVKKSFEMVILALSQRWPVLLYGPPGAGKSALITKLARDSQNQVLFIHMDDQIDGKTLIGSYVCTERAGEFRWQPGSLTQAVQNGFWVVFEDIDKASSDVQSILLPLLEGACSFVTGHGEEVKVADNFRLLSTISTSKPDPFRGTEGGNSLGVLWRKVMIKPPSNEDLQNIIKTQYLLVEPIATKLIETFEKVNASLHQLSGFHPGGSDSIFNCSRFSLRDLLKWCKRIMGLGFSFVGDSVSTYQSRCVYEEAVDIFAAFSSSAENRLTIMREIAKLWALPPSVAETFYPHNKPSIQASLTDLRIGRVHLQHSHAALNHNKKNFVEIRSSLHVLERIACSVKYNEPVLLVGETGTGKTTLVQNLAIRLSQKLTVLNLSQQSDVADLLGGFKPINAQFICFSLYKEFENIFSRTFPLKKNVDFLARLQKHFGDKNWRLLLAGFQKGVNFFRESVEARRSGSSRKRKKLGDEEKFRAWENFAVKLETAYAQIDASSGMIFSFVEGAFVTALRNGEWILLDEVNLAPAETLQRVVGVLEGENGSLCLAERGDVNYVCRHPDFRIFACMNPATDAGKRDLPSFLRSRFTEYFVDDVLDDEDLALFVNQFLNGSQSKRELVSKIVIFYKASKKASEEKLQDGANQKPQYSLRSLYRALEYTRKAERKFSFERAIYDGFCMFFLTMLDPPSADIMNRMILSHLLGGRTPHHISFDAYLTSEEDSRPNDLSENYVLTKSVKEQLRNLARAILVKRYPVLLQGPTSSGKTSLVKYLAVISGHEFVRINNHEHTDLQEYLGTYVTDACGNLAFQEGMLVKAVRNGYWIVLDELNLAPSDVLEALNRLLDDNRELFVPELGETIQAHPDFMLFATQNPPTFYGGRKMLSRAFRNRFVEIHVDEIPEDELITIVEKRCEIPENYAKKMIGVMRELQLHRQSSKIFAGKHGFITPRDLFRWAYRFKEFGCSYEDLARDGYYLLAERLRNEGEKSLVKEVLERHLRVKLDQDHMYKQGPFGGDCSLTLSDDAGASGILSIITFTKTMQRLCFLVERCCSNVRNPEPVLLVGETGGGKTTVCQLLSTCLKKKLHILNCHQYTETSDFIGAFYPIRDRPRLTSKFKDVVECLIARTSIHLHPDITVSSDIGQASSTLHSLETIIKSYRQGLVSFPDVSVQDLEHIKKKLMKLHQKWRTIFTWQDGPLVQAMRNGDVFLVDEISLADDSVLERLNSVLEPERKLSLPEKGGSTLETITAHPEFVLLATMNPGGDYGKKELSPALRNRFTEIWVPSVNDLNELRSIALTRLSDQRLAHLVDPMLSFWQWFNHLQSGRVLTVRDLLSWVAFIDSTQSRLGPEYAFLHGAFLVLLDGLSLGTGMSKSDAAELRERCFSLLLEKLKGDNNNLVDPKLERMESYGWGDFGTNIGVSNSNIMQCDNIFGIDPFYIEKGCEGCGSGKYEFLAPTTCKNALRVLRAMQLPKPVLLEGSPGVGKTSLIVALGEFSGHKVVRINLSEQTDIMDLLGSDLPVESGEGMKFSWSDGILLQALKEGCWVLLDELNLAPQSVLEGLNAILDHRAEVFIPELGLTFKCPSSFRVFACQNPSYQGGGRKGLPKSFLNRFTKVYLDELVEDDYLFICCSLYESIPRSLLLKLILFNKRLLEETMLYQKFAQDGSPWEFNLRDVLRSCHIIEGSPEAIKEYCFLNVVYIQRMRTASDRREVFQLYEQVFGVKPFINPYPRVQLSSGYLVVGNTAIGRNDIQLSNVSHSKLQIMPGIRQSLEAAAQCVRNQWLCILTGPSSSGKTSLLRLLSQLTGNVLNELNLSSATDISELIGCFEQYNSIRNFRSAVEQVEYLVNKYWSIQLKSSKEGFVREGREVINKWLAFSSEVGFHLVSSSVSVYVDNWKKVASSFDFLIEIIEKLTSCNEIKELYFKDIYRARKIILKMQESDLKRPFSAKFEWLCGVLIKTIERGEWIVLKNANLCNPTVLDRINSLVELCGSITVNECGTADGKPVVFHPHCNFRIFLTVNPKYGEVSRAMRNRGVEIYMMEPYWLQDGGVIGHEYIDLKNTKQVIALSGIPGSKLVESMARSHIYARDEGFKLNVRVTNLELSRWVQLFQQLVMKGNLPIWSLHISWEHIYLSSFGEAEGLQIIRHAKNSFLLDVGFSESDLSIASLCLPGGSPMPLKLRDFVWYSKEACVKQNVMYLEFLGIQCGSYELEIASKRYPINHSITASGFARTYLMEMKTLFEIMFPKASQAVCLNPGREAEYNLKLSHNKLLFASIWTIEQASERDLELYILWYSWFSSRLQPFCQFFECFLMSIRQVIKHPIWNYLCNLRYKIISLYGVDLDVLPIPMLSSELVDLIAQNDKPDDSTTPKAKSESSKNELKFLGTYLCNAINCIDLLRLSYQQWGAESRHGFSGEAQDFILLLKSLRDLEEDIFYKLVDSSSKLVESPSFDVLIQLCECLLEDHIFFWNCLTSSKFEQLQVSWRSLIKNVLKLKDFCPDSVEHLLRESQNLENGSPWCVHLEKSLLWLRGGHPVLPPSVNLYHKQQQLFELCESIWPVKTKLQNHVEHHLVEVIASADPELRFLAMEGLSMSICLVDKCRFSEDDAVIVQHLEDIYQTLVKRLEHEKNNWEAIQRSKDLAVSDKYSSACCSLDHGVLFRKLDSEVWLDTLPFMDTSSFFLDMTLLQELSSILLADEKRLEEAISRVSTIMKSTLNFSLSLSSRPPQMFVPHQNILWTLDEWSFVYKVNAKVASFVLEMWFRWHQTLWNYRPDVVKSFSRLGNDTTIPHLLVQPLNVAAVFQILQSTPAIKNIFMHQLKIRIASSNVWCSPPRGTTLQLFLVSAAHSLFQQILYAHEKSFGADQFVNLKSMVGSFQRDKTTQTQIQLVCALIMTSSHHRLKNSVRIFIEPLLRELYLPSASTDLQCNLGRIWLRLGGLRFHLLLSYGELDPAIKYHCKYSQLVEKKTLLELEVQVRQECEHLAGLFSIGKTDTKRAQALETLEVELKGLRRKIVFRRDPGKFKKLKQECDEFFDLVKILLRNIEATNSQQVFDRVHNWQEIATRFIERLSNDYSGYIDIVQPVQVAVYEMKLGVALILSSVHFPSRVDQHDIELVTETIYSYMRFPRGLPFNPISAFSNRGMPGFSFQDINSTTTVCAMDVDLLEKLVTLLCEASTDNTDSVLQRRAALHYNILVRLSHCMVHVKVMDSASFALLDKIFNEFAKLWMSMKVEAKIKEDYDSQTFKFRPRKFQIERVIDADADGDSFSNDGSLEWKELRSEEKNRGEEEASKQEETLEDEWSLMDESMLNQMVHIHDQLFGSHNLVLPPGNLRISDEDRLRSFSDSYTLGLEMIKDLGGFWLTSMDAKLAPENLLRLCLEHEETFVAARSDTCKYNFYKDSYASAMENMVKFLGPLRERVSSALHEQENHYGLQKILDISEMLLNIPIKTPLAKVLSGLQLLVNRAHTLQEYGSKLTLSDQLEPVIALICSLRKMELDSWPVLLDEVQYEYEKNAGKLWFPLYLVLQRHRSSDSTGFKQSTINSLVDFIQTSSIGEFAKRLKLLFAFLGQINTSRCLNMFPSTCEMETLEVLYNVFGYYVQFFPIIEEHIEVNRRKSELELKELQKLCRWEHPESYLSIENSRRTRQKLKKLIQKFSDLLQQPVMLFLNLDPTQKGIKAQSLQCAFDLTLFDKDRFIWFGDWREKVQDVLENSSLRRSPGCETEDIRFSEVASIFKQAASQSTCIFYQEEWKALWHTLEEIYHNAVYCGDLWKDAKKNRGKRRALSDLLKLLESSGLSRHKSILMEDQLHSWWFLRPSYDIQHLLMMQSGLPNGAADNTASREVQSFENEGSVVEWKRNSECFYKSIISVLLLHQICLSCHKDITREQVDRSCAFLNQLVEIQQKQLAAANVFARHFKRLKDCTFLLESLYSNSAGSDSDIGNEYEATIIQNQGSTYICMWQQKQLFDGLCAMMHEELLLLKIFDNTHKNTCQSAKAASNCVQLIEQYLPSFQRSKESLDDYLLERRRNITILHGDCCPFIVTKQMRVLVLQNFESMNAFRDHLSSLQDDDVDKSSVGKVLLSHFQEVFEKGRMIEREFNSGLEVKNGLIVSGEDTCDSKSYSELKAVFGEAMKIALDHILDALVEFIPSRSRHALPEEHLGHITSWEVLFDSFTANLSLDILCDKIIKAIFDAETLLNHYRERLLSHPDYKVPDISFPIGSQFKQLNVLLHLIMHLGDRLLQDFLAMNSTVSAMTNMLATVFANLYSKGFGILTEEQVDQGTHDTSEDASGTGMGEGAGLNDVSDQIFDEDQLLGANDKPTEEQDNPGELPSKIDKGIEMEQDFDADTFSVSEDSGEDNEDGEDGQLESAIGETGTNSEVVDEKLWNKDEDENPDIENEKYEPGTSVGDVDASCRELRAKDDSAASADERGEADRNEISQQDDEIGSPGDLSDGENTEDGNLDKMEDFSDPTGLKLEELNLSPEEGSEIDEREDADSMKEADHEEHEGPSENGVHEEEKPTDETMTDSTMEQEGETSERDGENRDKKEGAQLNFSAAIKDVFQPGTSDIVGDHVPNADSATQPNDDILALDSSNILSESNLSNEDENRKGNAMSSGAPSSDNPEMNMMAGASLNAGRLTDSQPQTQLPSNDSSSTQKTQPNPYRNIGDALKDWKERARVSVDIQRDGIDVDEEVDDKNADEYGYVSEFEKGTEQALGAATSEQIDRNVNSNNYEKESIATHSDDLTEMEIERENSGAQPSSSRTLVDKTTTEDHMTLSGLENLPNEGVKDVHSLDGGDPQNLTESLVSVKRSYFSDGLDQFSRLSVSDDELGKASDPFQVTHEVKTNAAAIWRRYELDTMRLSQELAEQLRLIMEPTLASKLQGDYKTGKRINMKKVIPYIASHYRKDKIWLRRTRPNKRDYQVVIAVDDSRSMSESCCGGVAIEALVTVCRAMSQLDMGRLAVASFGKKGNIRLLHDFDQPFTGEAGIKMISNLTFEQENSITDEPVVDLLKYLSSMLDEAVVKARLPSGWNPLQQLVLIIADGRFHEKEKLRHYVRDVMSRKRMVAFLLLDSPQESIMELKEASFDGGNIKFSKYMDSFPFPYYIILKNIEALPRTLADLLRQWFELMQSSGD